MTGPANKTKQISLGADFGDAAVKINGIGIEIRTNRSVLACENTEVRHKTYHGSGWEPPPG